MSEAQDLQSVEIGGKSYALVGKAAEMPMGVFNPARKLARKAAEAANNEEARRAFYLANMDQIVDVTEGVILFSLGPEQYAEAKEALDALNILEFCALGTEVMNKHASLTL